MFKLKTAASMKTSKMLSVLLLVCGVAFLTVLSARAGNPAGFTNSHVQGSYGFNFSGVVAVPADAANIFTDGASQYRVGSGVFVADGNGGGSGTLHQLPKGTDFSPNADIGQPPFAPLGPEPFVLTYVVNPDGTGLATITTGPSPGTQINFAFVLTEVRGNVAQTVLLNFYTAVAGGPGFFASGQAIRQFTSK